MLIQQDWRRLVWWPTIAFALAFGVLELGHLDRPIAETLFFDPLTGWSGAEAGAWWARDVIHQAGRWLPRGVAAAALLAALASSAMPALRAWRREFLYVFIGMALVIAAVGLLKEITNVDCPWDLAGFGGTRPYVTLFGHRPDALPRAACFPGAHASSGFALLAVWFALRGRAPRAARVAFWTAIAVGVIFSIGQEARGAHFLSHDLTSAAIAWLVLVSLYSKMLLRSQVQARQRVRQHAGAQAAEDVAREA